MGLHGFRDAALGCGLLLAWLSAGPTANAATVVNWGGNYVSINAAFNRSYSDTTGDFGGNATIHDVRTLMTFSELSTLSPASSYTSPTGKSKAFYGGYEAINFDTSSSMSFQARAVVNASSNDRIGFAATPGANGGAMRMALVFRQPDFLTGYTSGNLYLDADNTSIAVTTSSAMTNLTGRFMVKSNGSYYLSSVTFTNSATLANPTVNSLWAPYDPTAGIDFNQSAATFSPMLVHNVSAIGYYVEADNAPSAVSAAVYVSGFTANANTSLTMTSIPLPSAAQLGLAAMALLAIRRLRLRKQSRACSEAQTHGPLRRTICICKTPPVPAALPCASAA